MNNIITFPTSISTRHCPIFRKAADVQIVSFIRQKRRFFCLDELYCILSAVTAAEKNGIQWAIANAKEKGLISSTGERSFYKINQP
jgi:predicted transcriptional regulator